MFRSEVLKIWGGNFNLWRAGWHPSAWQGTSSSFLHLPDALLCALGGCPIAIGALGLVAGATLGVGVLKFWVTQNSDHFLFYYLVFFLLIESMMLVRILACGHCHNHFHPFEPVSVPIYILLCKYFRRRIRGPRPDPAPIVSGILGS